jgi:hypothetical protein
MCPSSCSVGEGGETPAKRVLCQGMKRGYGSLIAAVVVASGVLWAATGSLATTTPSGHVYVPVVLTDSGITVIAPNPDSGDTGDPRGVIATFTVVNRGMKPHSFAFLGKTTGAIKPGGRKEITLYLLTRGEFVYRNMTDHGKTFSGLFKVY